MRQFCNRALVEGKTITRRAHCKKRGCHRSISPRYLSDSLKSKTGKTAMEYLHLFLISEAKHLLKTANKGVAEIAYMLGFEDTSWFSRLFKKQVGITPLKFKGR